MSAVWMRFRSELRSRWRAWLALAVVLGIVSGAGIAASADARRTASAYPRFVERHRAYDVILGGIGTDDPAVRQRIIRDIIARPEVEAFTRGGFLVTDRVTVRPSGTTFSFPEIFIGGLGAQADLETINTPVVVKGRLFEPDATDEAVVDFTVAERLGLRVGQRLELPLSNQETGETVNREARLVGIIAQPWDMPAVGWASLAGLTLSPGFMKANAAYISQTEDAPSVKLRRGAADIPSFIRAVEKVGANVDVPATLPQHMSGVRKTLRFEVSALWLLAAIIAFASLAIVGQALGRQATADADDYGTLRALAMSRRRLFGVGMIRASTIGVVAAAVAVIVAILASRLTPHGLARVVEPSPGIAADWTVLGVGFVSTVAIALVASALPAWRAAGSRKTETERRSSRIAQGLANAGAGPSVVAGVRLALDPGHGRRALPVRSTIVGIAVALAAFWAAAGFTKSLDHLVGTPALQGFAWDAITTGPSQRALEEALRGDPGVAAVTPGGATNIVVGGERIIPFTYAPGKIAPVTLSGRAPKASDEIAFGSLMLRRLDKRVGDEVEVVLDANPTEGSGPPPSPLRFRIVGEVVVPPFFFKQVEPGFGSALTIEGFRRLDPQAGRSEEGLPLVIRYRPGADVRAKLEALRKKVGFLFTFQIRQPGAELAGISRSSGLPLTLTEILLFMAATTLVHALVTAVRKRRHELAILKTLGFSRRQVWNAVSWQASTFVVLALALGLPAGTALGRWAWMWFVDTLGLVPAVIAPSAIVVVLVVLSTLVLGNAIALLPGRAAARTKPALVLRTE